MGCFWKAGLQRKKPPTAISMQLFVGKKKFCKLLENKPKFWQTNQVLTNKPKCQQTNQFDKTKMLKSLEVRA